MRNIVRAKGEKERDALSSFFLLSSLLLSLFFTLRAKFRENSTAKNGSRISPPVLSVSRDDARPDYEMLNGTATARTARYSSKFYSFWQLARPKRKPPPREHALCWVSEWLRPGFTRLFFWFSLFPTLFRDLGQDSRFDNFIVARKRLSTAFSLPGIIFLRRA